MHILLTFNPSLTGDNFRDGFVHDFILAFTILSISGLVGLFLGWLMWRNHWRRATEIERENDRIRAKQRTA